NIIKSSDGEAHSSASALFVPSSLRGMKLALRRIPHRIPTLSAHHHHQQNHHTSAAHRTNPTAPPPSRLSVQSRTPGTRTHSQPLAARSCFSTSTTRHTSPQQTVTMANRVHRVTMFKLPNKDHQEKLLAAYRTLSAEHHHQQNHHTSAAHRTNPTAPPPS
ncbi:hypothetical protein ACHAPH_009251, partial [Verticillium nonalfalfae]